MNQAVTWLGNGAGAVGVLFCVIAGLVRISGNYWLWGMDAMTVFTAGVGLMVFACLAKLQLLTQGQAPNP
ncbi:hypothetical protein [Motiliproteus sediminis]|uniref:hypothetical protein n=1 Tax=Motiliproteus sediminis TaxID=1468178 RepID=UPI001AEFAD48|nr:hypothetical protein [Motiliproteus sediminis]